MSLSCCPMAALTHQYGYNYHYSINTFSLYLCVQTLHRNNCHVCNFDAGTFNIHSARHIQQCMISTPSALELQTFCNVSWYYIVIMFVALLSQFLLLISTLSHYKDRTHFHYTKLGTKWCNPHYYNHKVYMY